MSDKNPFRKHASSEEQATVSPSPLPPLPPSPDPLASPPQSPPSGPSQSAIPASPTHGVPIPEDVDEEDLPPPYTPAANIGEETIGLGPRRPFQQPPSVPSSSLHPPQDPRNHSNWPPPTTWPSQPSFTGQGLGSGFRMQPEPRLTPWQRQQQYRQRQNGGGGLLGALFETVRDIADVVSGAHDDRMMVPQNSNAGVYAAPYSSTGSVYAPPPPRSASTPPRSPPMVPDDGTPTRTPVPGHPLLRDGTLLVYPKDHLCVKCKNTGYKNYDPSNPCRKCWDKYGKPYTGALTYASWSPSRNDPRMQRPLPKFQPPHLAGPSPESYSGPACASEPRHGPYPPPPQHPQHSRSISQPHSQAPGLTYFVVSPLSQYDATPPVPHAIPVSPGDPRLGGRLCMRCGGEGIRMVMLIDVTTCEICGGTGRVWV